MAGLEDTLAAVLSTLGFSGPTLKPSFTPAPPTTTAANTLQVPQQQPPSAAGGPQAMPTGAPLPASPPAAAPPAAPPQESGLEKFVGNPLLQMALAGYLGTIGSPRREGLGMALARGGLTGLNAFNIAEEEKGKLPLEAAKIAESQAQTQNLGARTALAGAQEKKLAGDPQANAAAAQQLALIAQDPGTDPTKKAIINSLIPNVQAGITPPEKAWKIIQDGDVNAAKIEASKAAAGKATAETSLIPLKGQEMSAHIGELGTASTKNLAEAEKARNEATTGGIKPKEMVIYNKKDGSEKVVTLGAGESVPEGWTSVKPSKTGNQSAHDLQVEKQARSQAEKDWAEAGTREHLMGDRDKFIAERVAKYKADLSGGTTTPASGPLRGTHNGVMGTFDPSTGMFTPDA